MLILIKEVRKTVKINHHFEERHQYSSKRYLQTILGYAPWSLPDVNVLFSWKNMSIKLPLDELRLCLKLL